MTKDQIDALIARLRHQKPDGRLPSADEDAAADELELLSASKPAAPAVDVKACRAGFEQQRKVSINVDWFTWQIAWHDAMFTVRDIAGDELLSASKPAAPMGLPQPVLDALRFYAHGHHFTIDDDHQQFDTVSGEPQNWLCSERVGDCTIIEDGSIAKAVLLGGLPGFEEPTEPLEGEVFAPAASAGEQESERD